ncbi:MAG TPA: hypothetical protein VFF28_08085 [Candidatus Nanoarchaeia archaeon]|nr:hypothetical protein [Candidatus Nanoarchaeia archaeon]
MRKAQLAHPLLYAFIAIVSITLLSYGAVQIIKLASTEDKLQLLNFQKTLANSIKKQAAYNYGTVDEKSFALSPSIRSVCFIDKTKAISPLVKENLNPQINKYEDKTIFFEPFEKFSPIEIEGFELEENPLCLEPVNSVLRLSLTSNGNITRLGTFRPSDKNIDCVSVLYNSNNSINIVFLAYGYNKFEDFRNDVATYIDLFQSTEPFNTSNINFYRIDKLDQLNCEISQYIRCSEYEVKKLASSCPNDYIIILADRSKVLDILSQVRSSAVSNMAKINTADPHKLVVLHEFGHIFGNLADEYVDEKYYKSIKFDPSDYPNCDYPPECGKWSTVEGTGCFKGCSLDKFSRSTEDSLMRKLDVKNFGPLNEKILLERLSHYD